MLVLLSGVSGAGKDTIKKELIKRMDNVEALASYTDRLPRNDDIPGKTYNFVTTEEFERMIRDEELYEYNVYHEHYYGTSKKLLHEKVQNGKIIINDLDVNGVENLKKLIGDEIKIITIFLKVPKHELQKRLENRIDKLNIKDITARLNRFDYEESRIGIYDYVIKNNNLEKTVNIIIEIIKREYNLTDAEF